MGRIDYGLLGVMVLGLVGHWAFLDGLAVLLYTGSMGVWLYSVF
jgi:hypothetical protein